MHRLLAERTRMMHTMMSTGTCNTVLQYTSSVSYMDMMMYVRIYVSIYICIYVCMYLFIYVSMYE